MSSVIILGAKGRFGRAAVRAFSDAGWRVTQAARGIKGPDCVDLDATDTTAVVAACAGHDVIVNAVNPPYDAWPRVIPRLTDAVIAAARASGATVMIPGNIYNYGRTLPPVLTETTPWVANTKKGGIRIRMEEAYRNSGVRTIVLRGGDFIDTRPSGNWFESYIAPKAGQGKLTYPGPRDLVHAWAYLPDMARAMEHLARKRAQWAPFEEFGFPGYALTGDALIKHVSQTIGRPLRVSRLPWWMIRIAGLWSPLMREVIEMRYLWHRPHQVDGAKLQAALPDFKQTPVQAAIAASLALQTQAYVATVRTA